MKFIKTLITTFVLLYSLQPNAGIITLNFEAIVVDGSFAGQSGTGSISYDDDGVPTAGEAFLGFSGGIFADFAALTSFSFNFLGQDFFATDDSSYPDLPLFSLFDLSADTLDFFVEDGVGINILNPQIIDFQLFGEFIGGGLRNSLNGFDFAVDLFVTERQAQSNQVSTPNMFALTLLVCSVFLYRRVKF